MEPQTDTVSSIPQSMKAPKHQIPSRGPRDLKQKTMPRGKTLSTPPS